MAAGDAGNTFLERFLPGKSGAIKRLRSQIEKLNTPRNLAIAKTVLITGPNGAGKTRIAQVLAGHREWIRSEGATFDESYSLDSLLGNFAEVNLPNLPDTLVESELFGHLKGSFTGAVKDKPGLLSPEAEHTITDILLDEIGDASAALQAKLLQVAESGRFRRIGAAPGDDEKTDARLIFATNHDLAADVAAGSFREDLFWRLNVVTIHVPSLAEQRDAIPALLERTLTDLVSVDAASPPDGSEALKFVPADLDWAAQYAWPGNVRELRSAVLRWILEDGKKTLRETILEGAKLQENTAPNANDWLSAQLKSGKSLGSLNDVINRAQREARIRVVKWFLDTKPTNQELETRFPKMQALSIRNKLSKWKGEDG